MNSVKGTLSAGIGEFWEGGTFDVGSSTNATVGDSCIIPGKASSHILQPFNVYVIVAH